MNYLFIGEDDARRPKRRRTRERPIASKKKSGCNVRTVGYYYRYLEALWVLIFSCSILAIVVGTGASSEEYRISIFFCAFHTTALLQGMLYAFEDGKRWIILCFITCVVTDLASLLDVLIHFPEPRLYQWAWILNIIVPAYGLFISLYAITWYIWVWVHGYRFKAKKHSSEILVPEEPAFTC